MGADRRASGGKCVQISTCSDCAHAEAVNQIANRDLPSLFKQIDYFPASLLRQEPGIGVLGHGSSHKSNIPREFRSIDLIWSALFLGQIILAFTFVLTTLFFFLFTFTF